MAIYKVECQTLVTLEIEAESQEEAEGQALNELTERSIMDEFDWCISAYLSEQ